MTDALPCNAMLLVVDVQKGFDRFNQELHRNNPALEANIARLHTDRRWTLRSRKGGKKLTRTLALLVVLGVSRATSGVPCSGARPLPRRRSRSASCLPSSGSSPRSGASP
jgi:hypothetical protein